MSKYRGSPDGGVVDPDRGDSSDPAKKQGRVISSHAHGTRSDLRDGARELDSMVEAMAKPRGARDFHRAYPRALARTAEIDRRKRRVLPAEVELRKRLSGRQRKARSVVKRATLDAMPNTSHRAFTRMVEDPQTWSRINAELSAHVGDAASLTDADRRQVQRVDRAIQSYEKRSGRGHLVYTEVTMPVPVGDGRSMPRSLRPGAVVEFDRFTMTSHDLAELDARRGPNDVVLEIETPRGMYLGQSDSARGRTDHLLPRGMRFEVVGVRHAPYVQMSGAVGERLVVQLRDVEA